MFGNNLESLSSILAVLGLQEFAYLNLNKSINRKFLIALRNVECRWYMPSMIQDTYLFPIVHWTIFNFFNLFFDVLLRYYLIIANRVFDQYLEN